MRLFAKKKSARIPPRGCTAADIAVESSTCTGETTAGFRQKGSDVLLEGTLIRSPAELRAYYAQYGFDPPDPLPVIPRKR